MYLKKDFQEILDKFTPKQQKLMLKILDIISNTDFEENDGSKNNLNENKSKN